MPWRVGLDEAGYGPNLGPLVLSSSACQVPADAPPCLWECLAAAVRKAEHADDGRLLIDDSKKVNEGKAGLAKLEAGVLAVLAHAPHAPFTVQDYLSTVAVGDSVADVHAEPWFDPTDSLPAAHPADALPSIAARLADVCVQTG